MSSFINENPALVDMKIKSNQFESTVLSQGVFGKVYIATFEDGSKVVVKMIKNNTDVSLDNEVKFLKLIRSKCGEYFTCYITSGKYDALYDYIVFEYKDDYTVGQAGMGISNETIINLYKGLYTLHKLGIIHSDIKPSNLLINKKTNQIKYIDFGLSCYDYTCLSSGTPLYMDEKKSNNVSIDFIDAVYSDLYALNLSVMEMDIFEFPSTKEEYDVSISVLKSLFPDMQFEVNGWITDLIIDKMPA